MKWNPIATAPHCGRKILAQVPCFGHYQLHGKFRGYLPFIVNWCVGHDGVGFWQTGGLGKVNPELWMEIPAVDE